MTITLRPEQEKQIAQAMETGAFRDPQEVIESALEVLRAEEEWLHDHKGGISEKIDRAFAQFESGDFLSVEQSRADVERCKAAWLREQSR